MKAASVLFICLLALSACAPTYRPNPGNPYDFQGDLNNLGGPAPAADTSKSFWSQIFG